MSNLRSLISGFRPAALLPVLAGLVGGPASTAWAREVTIPLTASPAMIRDALVEQVFTEPGRRALFWGQPGDCSFFYLEDPEVDGEEGVVRVRAHGEARLGTEFLGGCFSPIAWSGNLEVAETPRMEGWEIHFDVVDSNVYDEKGKKALLTGALWDRIKESVHPRLGAVRIDLGKPFEELRAVLPSWVSPDAIEDAQKAFATLHPAAAVASARGVTVEARLEVPEPTPSPEASGPEPPLSGEEVAAFGEHLDQWDAFVTFIVRELGQRTLREATRNALLSVLLEARYEILSALAGPAHGEDPVRRLFVSSWERLGPVADEVARELPGAEALQIVTFVASGDALVALDQAGPSFGVEISADGLRRLARMVEPKVVGDPLEYAPGVDPKLRQFLDFGPAPEVAPEPSGFWRHFAPREALAAGEPWTGWVLRRREEAGEYVAKVGGLLRDTAERAVRSERIEAEDAVVYRRLLPATAWQESCWRQFHVRRGAVTYLRSPQASVGVLQINERVWRGFYDIERLRWDIAYNAIAGAEILHRYYRMVRAQQTEVDEKSTPRLARASYAAYNGGPGQLRRYLSGKSGPKVIKVIDGLFGAKFDTAPADVESEVARCLVGS